MIAADQPHGVPEGLCIGVSSRDDGTMRGRLSAGIHSKKAIDNRWTFCATVGSRFDECVYLRVNYLPESKYDVIEHVTRPNGEGARADIVYTETAGLGLFLTVADCIGTVIYDPRRKAVALAHLGRHSTLVGAMQKTIEYFVSYGSKARDLLIWMAPSIQQESYRMEYFEHADDPAWSDFCDARDGGYYLDLAGYNKQQAVACGVLPSKIATSPVDTATNPEYYSHSQGDTDERFAVVVQMTK